MDIPTTHRGVEIPGCRGCEGSRVGPEACAQLIAGFVMTRINDGEPITEKLCADSLCEGIELGADTVA